MDLMQMARGTPAAAAATTPRTPLAKMDQTALVFLENPIARRLAVAWVTCGGDEDEWLDTAGIMTNELADARRISVALRQNAVCRDNGVTDELAKQYIAALVAAPLRGPRGKSPKR